MQKRNRIAGFLAVLLAFCMEATVFAQELPDMARQGSIKVIQEEGETPVGDGTFTLFLVGEWTQVNQSYGFVPVENIKDSGVSLENAESPEAAAALEEYVLKNGLTGTQKAVDAQGEVVFEGLEPALYLMVQTQAAEGYYKAEAFLVAVPLALEGNYIYDVEANPKVEKESTPTPSPTPTPPGQTPSPTPTPPGQTPPPTPTPAPGQTLPPTPTPPPAPQIPQTGQLNWPIPCLIIAGMVFLVVGLTLRMGSGKDAHEE